MFTIKYSSCVSEEFIDDVVNLDAKAYPNKYQGEKSNIKSRFLANKETYSLLYSGNQLIGYVCFLPIEQSLAKQIRLGERFFDDDITPTQVIPYVKGNTHDIFIISLVVDPQYQNKGCGKQLVGSMFDFFNDKIQKGYKITHLYANVVSNQGRNILSDFDFQLVKKITDETDLYQYEFDDFSQSEVILFYSCKIIDGKLNKINYSYTDEYLDNMEKRTNEELDFDFTNQIKRNFLANEKIRIFIDEKDNKKYLDKDCKLYVTYFETFATIEIVFVDVNLDPTCILNQSSCDNIIVLNGEKTYSLDEYLLQYNLKKGKITKNLVSLTKKPTNLYLAYLLAGETFVNGSVDAQIISDSYLTKATKNLAQYNFSEIYASSKTVVYIFNDKCVMDKIKSISLMSFIMELLMLQICAIDYNYNQVVSAITSNNLDKDSAETVTYDFATSVKLWDKGNYKYALAEELAEKIYTEFKIEKLKNDYFQSLQTLEKLSAISSRKNVEKYSKSTKAYFTLFSLLSGFSTLNSFLALIFNVFVDKTDVMRSVLTLSIGLMSLIIFITILVVYNTKISKKSKKEKIKSKKK